jgi:hypothetical protein
VHAAPQRSRNFARDVEGDARLGGSPSSSFSSKPLLLPWAREGSVEGIVVLQYEMGAGLRPP